MTTTSHHRRRDAIHLFTSADRNKTMATRGGKGWTGGVRLTTRLIQSAQRNPNLISEVCRPASSPCRASDLCDGSLGVSIRQSSQTLPLPRLLLSAPVSPHQDSSREYISSPEDHNVIYSFRQQLFSGILNQDSTITFIICIYFINSLKNLPVTYMTMCPIKDRGIRQVLPNPQIFAASSQ